ncbi:hypothetical protein VCV18_004447 [Metarhizium anisopliae]
MAVLLAMNSKPVPFAQDGKILWPLNLNNHDAFTNSAQCSFPAPSRQLAVAPRGQSIPLIQATPSRVSGYTRLPLRRDFVQGVPGPIDMRVSVDRQSLAGIQQLHQEFGASAISGQMLCAKLFLWLRRHFICEQSPVRKPAVADTGRGEAARRGGYPVFGLRFSGLFSGTTMGAMTDGERSAGYVNGFVSEEQRFSEAQIASLYLKKLKA